VGVTSLPPRALLGVGALGPAGTLGFGGAILGLRKRRISQGTAGIILPAAELASAELGGADMAGADVAGADVVGADVARPEVAARVAPACPSTPYDLAPSDGKAPYAPTSAPGAETEPTTTQNAVPAQETPSGGRLSGMSSGASSGEGGVWPSSGGGWGQEAETLKRGRGRGSGSPLAPPCPKETSPPLPP